MGQKREAPIYSSLSFQAHSLGLEPRTAWMAGSWKNASEGRLFIFPKA